MRLSRLLSLSLSIVGGAASARVLQQRHAWEQTHNRVAICIDFDDVYSAAVRAGIPLDGLLNQIAEHGATHLSLPELTLNRLLKSGELTPQAPAARAYPTEPAPVGHWNFLAGASDLVHMLAVELCTRLPYTAAHVIDQHILAFAGELQTIAEIGLGFDAVLAARIQQHDLRLVLRPVSYAWPEDDLINLTLAQAAVFGNLVAFDTDMIIGHELHLHTTFAAMEREGLSFVYFAESRHQKGDWFMAKRLAPRVVIGQRLTPAEMVPLDFQAAAQQWAYFARERGVRLCYLNFFKVLHATEPLEGLHYIKHVKQALEADGFVVTSEIGLPTPVPAPTKQELALTGMASASAASAAMTNALNLPEVAAVPLTILAAIGSASLPYLERARGHLEEQYPPSYAPKLLALAASLAPAAAQGDDALEWAEGVAIQAAATTAVAVATSGQDYHLRVEEYRGFNLHWAIPLASAALKFRNPTMRIGSLSALALAWLIYTRRNIDPIARFDPAHAEGHTHHLSTASRIMGDVQIALGPQPARKWTGLGAVGVAASVALSSYNNGWATGVALLGALGNIFGLVGWRRPERALAVTAREALPSWALGLGLGALVLLLRQKDR